MSRYYFTEFTHIVQWRKSGYWAPGAKFISEAAATEYAEMRVCSHKGGSYRVVPVTKHGELKVDQCLVILKCIHQNPDYWRKELAKFFDKGVKPKMNLTDDDLQMLVDIDQQYPRGKFMKLNPEVVRGRLKMADARERAHDVIKPAEHLVVLDANPEVMTLEQGAFVQAWVFVPNRGEEEELGRQHDIAAYLAGKPRAVAA